MPCNSTGGGGGNAMAAGGGGQVVQQLTNEQSQILYGLPEQEQKEFYFHSGYPKQTVDIADFDGKQKLAKYDSVTINEDLPEITGKTEKQIQYAKDIRLKGLAYEANDVAKKLKQNASKKALQTAKTKEQVMDDMFSSFGVSSISEFVTKYMKQNPNSVFSKYQKMTTASDIIEKGKAYY